MCKDTKLKYKIMKAKLYYAGDIEEIDVEDLIRIQARSDGYFNVTTKDWYSAYEKIEFTHEDEN